MQSRLLSLLLLVTLASCGGSTADTPTPTSPSAPATPELTLDESVTLPESGFTMKINCYGEGAPTTLLEAGYADEGIMSFGPPFLKDLAAEGGTVCTYDRVGTGQSERPPPDERRTLRDQVNELHELLVETDLPTPYVLAGSSWGGFVVMDFAAVYPDGVGALVLLDVPAPSATLTEEDLGGSWDEAPNNPERVDALEAEHRLAEHPPQIPPVPLRVVTATEGQSDVANQSFWMELTPESESIVLEGGHDIHQEDPDGVIEVILEAIGAASG